MAGETSDTDRTTGSASKRATNGSTQHRLEDARAAIRTAGDQVGGAVTTVRETVPEVAKASRHFFDDAMKRIEAPRISRSRPGSPCRSAWQSACSSAGRRGCSWRPRSCPSRPWASS